MNSIFSPLSTTTTRKFHNLHFLLWLNWKYSFLKFYVDYNFLSTPCELRTYCFVLVQNWYIKICRYLHNTCISFSIYIFTQLSKSILSPLFQFNDEVTFNCSKDIMAEVDTKLNFSVTVVQTDWSVPCTKNKQFHCYLTYIMYVHGWKTSVVSRTSLCKHKFVLSSCSSHVQSESYSVG